MSEIDGRRWTITAASEMPSSREQYHARYDHTQISSQTAATHGLPFGKTTNNALLVVRTQKLVSRARMSGERRRSNFNVTELISQLNLIHTTAIEQMNLEVSKQVLEGPLAEAKGSQRKCCVASNSNEIRRAYLDRVVS